MLNASTTMSASTISLKLMGIFCQYAQTSMLTFHPSIVRLRCLLWGHFKVLNTEEKTVLQHSKLISQLFEQNATSTSPLIEAVFHLISVTFIPPVFVYGVFGPTLEYSVEFFHSLLSAECPISFIAALCRILKDSRGLCRELFAEQCLKDYDLDLSPECYFHQTVLTSNSVLEDWRERYQHTLEQAPKGLMAQDDSTFKTLKNMLHSKSSRPSTWRPTKPVVKPLISAIVQQAQQLYSA